MGEIYPSENTRKHWQERLKRFGIEITDNDCYKTIYEKCKGYKKELLQSDIWIPVERWIIESWFGNQY